VSPATPPLFAIDSPFPEANSTLRLLESPSSSPELLWDRLSNGTYDKPFIVDSGQRRFLHFDFETVQSAMHLPDPDKLCLAYTRKMMAFLLFNPSPERILVLGLGGGSLAKFCYRRLRCAVTAVEMNPDVIALREEFGIPADDSRFRVVHEDGSAYVVGLTSRKDVILMDACDRTGIAPEFNTIEFYQSARRCLSPGGVFVSNLCGDRKGRVAHLVKIRRVFGDQCMTLSVRWDGNVIVFAFKERARQIDWAHLEVTASTLTHRLGLDFPKYVRRLALDRKLRDWQGVFSEDRVLSG